jgi:integrase
MNSYEPEIDTAIWLEIRDFVTAAVTDTAGATAYQPDTLLIAATRLTAWCWETGGLPLERDVIFHRDTIAHFIAVGLPYAKPAARGNLRSQLLRMSEVLLARSASLRKLGALPPSDPSVPYSAGEVIALRNWGAAQSTPGRRTNAGVLLALGLGGGLSASEIGETRVRDVRVDDAGVVIDVPGTRARSVPVLRDWEDALRRRTEELGADRYVFRESHQAFYPNLISSFVNRGQWTPVRLQTQRMRATWIVHHLSVGTPVVVLMRAAGVDSLEAFTRYVRFVAPTDEDEARVLLRG